MTNVKILILKIYFTGGEWQKVSQELDCNYLRFFISLLSKLKIISKKFNVNIKNNIPLCVFT